MADEGPPRTEVGQAMTWRAPLMALWLAAVLTGCGLVYMLARYSTGGG